MNTPSSSVELNIDPKLSMLALEKATACLTLDTSFLIHVEKSISPAQDIVLADKTLLQVPLS